MDKVWQRHSVFAETVWAAVDAWSAGGAIRLHVAEPSHRSTAVTTIVAADGNGPRIRAWCTDMLGVTLGFGVPIGERFDDRPDNLFRIGHMGHVTPASLLGSLACVDTALSVLNIPHGDDAMRHATQKIAASLAD